MRRLAVAVMAMVFLLGGCSGAQKWQSAMQAHQKIVETNLALTQARLDLARTIANTPLVKQCDAAGNCLTVNMQVDSAFVNGGEMIKADLPDPDAMGKVAWQTMGGIFTTGLKVAAGAYIAHEVVDFASSAVSNAGHNTTLSGGDGSTNFVGPENTVAGEGIATAQGDMELTQDRAVGGDVTGGSKQNPMDSYNQNPTDSYNSTTTNTDSGNTTTVPEPVEEVTE